ncbi:alpha/beta hydrolase-fold protein [Marivirga arenosa]|uniref:Alpha/beta hydrolase-fold protein n=1 Tax=Marivirga arenosa TaxID=3059076 RepID=A0AA49GDT9_9BACT|nr:alpha/beta hydrolase-fold protein [Marivirga sp. BKB1-2]WKK82767.2 alpha/beta hydrolase-fold protein [Marivirga sp. BKB1-2]
MRNKIIVLLLLLIELNSAQSQDSESIIIGKKHTIHSNILDEEREYWISLPESYSNIENSYKEYPILIVLDGDAHFKSISGMLDYMSSGYNGNTRVPEMIVVAIQNVNRRRDFTPDKVVTVRENDTGGGENFLSFLEDELIPELDQKYRTIPYRILFGHSLGGLLATHAYMKEETLFNAFIAVDPSFGTWDANTMDQKIAAVTENSFDRYLYLATANWGKRNFTNRDRHLRLFEALNSKCDGQFPAKYEYFENENHGSVPPLAFYNAITSIFEGYGVYYRDINDSEQLVKHFELLSNRLSFEFNPPEFLVNRIAYYLLRSKDEKDRSEALKLFELNTKNYPNSFNAFDSLGEAFEALGENKKARQNYEKSIELNPKNQHAKMKIESLKKSK